MALEKPNLTFPSTLKYDVGKIIPWMADNAGMYDILSSSFAYYIKSIPAAGSYTILTEIYRPDLLAYNIYGYVTYKVPLMLYNDMITPLDCYSGRVITFPSLLDLDKLLYSL